MTKLEQEIILELLRVTAMLCHREGWRTTAYNLDELKDKLMQQRKDVEVRTPTS